MDNEFDRWNSLKKRIHTKDSSKGFFDEREIWWCHLGLNIGHEQNGRGDPLTRPVLIVRKLSSRMCYILPLSTKVLRGNYFFPVLSESNVIRMGLLHQIRSIDSRRLKNHMDGISEQEHLYILEKVAELFQQPSQSREVENSTSKPFGQRTRLKVYIESDACQTKNMLI